MRLDTALIPVLTLTRDEAVLELERLARLLGYHDYLYFNTAFPEISDSEYDLMRSRNTEIELKFPDLRRADSVSYRVGSPVSIEFQKVKHKDPMLSLDNVFTLANLSHFLSKVSRFLMCTPSDLFPIMAEPKIDGLSAALYYQRGQFTLGLTRGDGREGENVTTNLKTIIDIPKILPTSYHGLDMEIRGEVYMAMQDFLRLNEERAHTNEPIFINPRNAAAGSLRQLDSSITERRHLKFFAYYIKILNHDGLKTQYDAMVYLKELGFQIADPIRLCNSESELIEFYTQLESMRTYLPYEIDGAVYKINSLALQDRLGTVGRSPRYAVAHKFLAEQATTVIENIIIQVGRTGTLTPVALFTPTFVGGAHISRASLHNELEIKRKDIRIGDTVIIHRSGDVIPQIIGVVLEKRPPHSMPFSLPSHCPSCGGNITRVIGQVAQKCTQGFKCRDQAIERLTHFVGRDAMQITGLGQRLIERFYDQGVINSPVDILTLPARGNDLGIQNYEGLGPKAVQNLYDSILKGCTTSLDRFIFSLGIPQVGLTTATLLTKQYPTLSEFLSVQTSDLIAIEGLGEATAECIIDFLSDPITRLMIEDLSHLITFLPAPVSTSNHILNGKVIVFTGVFLHMSRKEAKNRAQIKGAHVHTHISKHVDFLVIGEKPGSKKEEANRLGIQIVSESEWINLIE